MSAFAEIAVGVPIDGTFHYRVPARIAGDVTVGRRVTVPFGRRKATGWVVGALDALPADGFSGELKEILAALDDGPMVLPDELALYRWIADYYRYPLGLVLKAALPAGVDGNRIQALTERVFVPPENSPHWDDILRARIRAKAPAQGAVLDALHAAPKNELSSGDLRAMLGERGVAAAAQLVKKGHLRVAEREVLRAPPGSAGGLTGHEPAEPPPLMREQAAALAEIERAADAGAFAPMLLQGVTGSGKTEVYLRAIAGVLARGRGALVLVPEIALTPQLVGRFRARFGGGIAVLHSGLSDGQRYDEWRRLRRGEARIAVGARSAVFAPIADLGIVVVDEEHDGSYKQDEGLRYHARDVALVRARGANAVAILGSATPSLESHHHALTGKYKRLVMAERVGDRPMPPVELVSLARGQKKDARRGPLGPKLLEALRETIAAKQQAILFLNRRGYAPSVVCEDCGHVFQCPDCAVALIFHAPELAKLRKAAQSELFPEDPDVEIKGMRGWLSCHYCGLRAKPRSKCGECGSEDLRLLGIGTQRLERELAELLPKARIERMDRDTTTRKGAHEKILERLAAGEIDVLLGTQMIAKGLDFPGVTLVGVVLADTALNLADFRAAERTFQLLTQVAGRAGRGDIPGRVIVQTFHPQHYAIACAARHDFDGFAERELQSREELFYPPFSRLVNLRLIGADRDAVERAATDLRERLRLLVRGRTDVRVVGPAPAPLSMLRGKHRWQVLVRAASSSTARWAAQEAIAQGSLGREKDDVRVDMDVDPQSLL